MAPGGGHVGAAQPRRSLSPAHRGGKGGGGMRSVLTIARRELSTYFVSPLAYLILAVFVLVIGLSFCLNLIAFANECLVYGSNPYFQQQLNVNEQVVRPLFGGFVPVFLLILFPAITMRLIPEEKRQGTAELILTSPITSTQIVLGKYLGALVVSLIPDPGLSAGSEKRRKPLRRGVSSGGGVLGHRTLPVGLHR
ncbi:MAG: hypothetical protein DMH00_05065 [Acidobacteria bacterium]|nr:MAG: hypothetical protein DMH00_05065 [Acidobacteriota bacterium]